LGKVIVFSFAWEHVQIEEAKWLAGLGIGDGIELQIVHPLIGSLDLLKFQTKNLLVDGKHAVQHILIWEIDLEGFFIDGVFLFLELVGVITPIPKLDFRIGITSFLHLDGFEFRKFPIEFGLQSGFELFFKSNGCGSVFGHFGLDLIIGPCFVAEFSGNLIAKNQNFLEQGNVFFSGQIIADGFKL